MNAAAPVQTKNFTRTTSNQRVEWRDLPAATRVATPSPTKPVAPAKPVDNVPEKPEHAMLFQQYFKSVGTRTYVAQLKVATNGNHYLVLTEASRVKGTDEVRKTRIFIYSEDFKAFFDLLSAAQKFISRNPVPSDVAAKQSAFWRKAKSKQALASRPGCANLRRSEA